MRQGYFQKKHLIRNFIESKKMHIDSIEKARCVLKNQAYLAASWPNFLEGLRIAQNFWIFDTINELVIYLPLQEMFLTMTYGLKKNQ